MITAKQRILINRMTPVLGRAITADLLGINKSTLDNFTHKHSIKSGSKAELAKYIQDNFKNEVIAMFWNAGK